MVYTEEDETFINNLYLIKGYVYILRKLMRIR